MALEQGLKQRIVGAVVLLGLAVIFLPMLLSRQDDVREVRVEVPPMPKPVVLPDMAPEPVQELPSVQGSQAEYVDQPVLDEVPEPKTATESINTPEPATVVKPAEPAQAQRGHHRAGGQRCVARSAAVRYARQPALDDPGGAGGRRQGAAAGHADAAQLRPAIRPGF